MPRRYVPIKLRLGECRDQQVTALQFTCIANGRRCFHRKQMDIAEAIERWGENRRVDDLPVRCSKCRASRFDDEGRPNVFYDAVGTGFGTGRIIGPSR